MNSYLYLLLTTVIGLSIPGCKKKTTIETCSPENAACSNPDFECCIANVDLDALKFTCRPSSDCIKEATLKLSTMQEDSKISPSYGLHLSKSDLLNAMKKVEEKLNVFYDLDNVKYLHEQSVEQLNFALQSSGISSKNELAMFLAHVAIETGGFNTLTEAATFEYAGCGYLQITGEDNYRKASNDLFGDDRLVKDPSLACNDNTIAWQISFWYWKHAVQVFPGFLQDSEYHFGASTMVINGIQCPNLTSPRSGTVISPINANTLAALQRHQAYIAIFNAWGLEGQPADNCGCEYGNYVLQDKPRQLVGTVGEHTPATLLCSSTK
jgi:hypothetical protein